MPLTKDTQQQTSTSVLCRVRIFALGSVSRDNGVELDTGEWNHDSFEVRTERTLSLADSEIEMESEVEELDIEEETEATHSGDLLCSKIASEAAIMEALLQQLSEQDLEAAASASYQYHLQTRGESTGTEDRLSLRRQYASNMARRHLRAEKGDSLRALDKLKKTLQFRRDICVNETRESFNESTRAAKHRQRRISQYLGPQGKLFVRGYDPKGHACVHCIPRHLPSPENTQDPIGCLLSFLFILEKAIACSESHEENTDGMIVVSVDLRGFQHRLHVPPMNVVREMLIMLRDHYPNRLFRVYLFDAPLVFRYTWALLKPRMDPETRNKFQFVTGRFQRLRIFRANGGAMDWSQCMPYQHPKGSLVDPVDMEAFYQLSFNHSYGDEQHVHDS